MEELTDTV